ncbi:zinc-ribbon domain-containing protein [Mediterranea massiliensis]|uniref:zinc-ribbon domain-containing protein n=1 Tax=Mediterranea massiliensis TaxID=1841865 RepID=UPI0023F4DF1B|nr:zinc-ribbon domain-containing protein [Mediterranea massiliensis]
MNCSKCSAPLKPNAKFCVKCGTKVSGNVPETAQPQNQPNESQQIGKDNQGDLIVTNQRIHWNITPGQIARIITEQEMATYKDAEGIIIAEGTTAFIRANGTTIATISGGSYDFQPRRGTVGEVVSTSINNAWQIIINLFKSRRKLLEGQSEQEAKIEMHAKQQREIFAQAKAGASFSIVILLDRAFPMLVGAKQEHPDDYKNFKPMLIHTRHHDMNVGLNAYFRIKKQEEFILHYLVDKQYLNTAILIDEIAETVRTTIQEVLYDQPVTSNRIPGELFPIIKENLNKVAEEAFWGLEIVRIVEISADNEDIQRFNTLSHEMYLSEQELDYLRRTNDFKNRLTDVNNSQQIHTARTAVELQQRLNEINRDQLLSEDEMNKFVLLLENERLLREARTTEEREAALAEIERTRLIREDDLAEIRALSEQHAYQRGMALRLSQLKDSIEFERIRMEGANELMVEKAKTELHIQQMIEDQNAANKQRNADFDYQQRKRDADLQFEQRKREHDLEMEEDKQQQERLMQILQAQEASKENERKHQADMQAQQFAHNENMANIQSNLTPEQILAMSGGDVALEFARSYTARSNADVERAASERLNEEQRRNQEMMYQLMNRMLDNQANQANLQTQQTFYQQQRADNAYNQSLNYTTRQGYAPNGPVNRPAQQEQAPSATHGNIPDQGSIQKTTADEKIYCPECGASISKDAKTCPECGQQI